MWNVRRSVVCWNCPPPEPDADAERHWRKTLSPYFDELGIDSNDVSAQAGRAPFSAEMAEVLAEFKPPVVSFHFGLPATALMKRIRGWGGKILSTATTVDEALCAEIRGQPCYCTDKSVQRRSSPGYCEPRDTRAWANEFQRFSFSFGVVCHCSVACKSRGCG